MRACAAFALCLVSAPLLASPAAEGDVAAAVGAEPNTPAERLSVIVLDLEATTSTPEVTRLINDLVAVSLQRTGRLEVLTSEDVRSVMAFEAEKQAAGCDDASCLAELAGALGAALVVHGSVGQLGELFIVNLNLFDSRLARSAGRESAQVRDRSDLPAAIDAMTRRLVGGTIELAAPEPTAGEAPPSSSPWLSPLFLGGAAIGALAASGAVFLGAWALTLDSTLADGSLDGATRAQTREQGLGVLVGAGVLGIAAVGGAAVASVPFFE